MLLSVSMGCSIGVKEKVRIVYSQLYPEPMEAQGAIRIATNKPIPITISGLTDVATKKDLGGMYAIDAADLAGFVKAAKELKKLKDEHKNNE